jgi:hypothetical protein
MNKAGLYNSMNALFMAKLPKSITHFKVSLLAKGLAQLRHSSDLPICATLFR